MNFSSAVIGANSFLGQEIISQELLLNHNVLGVYHHNTDKLLQQVEYHSFEEFYLLESKIDVIYIVSAYVPNTLDVDQERLFEVNVNLVEKLSSLFPEAKLVLASSVSVYENTKNSITEKGIISPVNTYGLSKLWAEYILKKHKNYSIVRISSMYGIGMNLNTFIPRVILSAIKEKKIKLFGDGSRLQNYVHVSHVAKVMVASAYIESNHILLAVGKKSVSNKDVANYIKNIDKSISIEYVGEDNSPSFIYDDTDTKKLLNINNNESLEQESKNIWNWLKKF